MADQKEKLPLDARLLCDAIIELNISRRNVSLYPKGHPSVQRSIIKAYQYLQKLFELRPSITLAVAKDTLIIDEHYLDKKNPVFKDFALTLSRLNIAYITFNKGLDSEELYSFHKIISTDKSFNCLKNLKETFNREKIIHIEVGCIDYDAFSFEEGPSEEVTLETKNSLWERYIYGLISGSISEEEAIEAIKKIPVSEFAEILNNINEESLKEETYDRVITTYLKRSSETVFSNEDMKRLLEMINSLRPELRKQFLQSSVRIIGQDRDKLKKSIEDLSVDTIISMLDSLNKENITIPETLKSILDKFSALEINILKSAGSDESLLLDDIMLSPEMKEIFQKGEFNKYVSEDYSEEINKVLQTSLKKPPQKESEEILKEFSEPIVYKDLCSLLVELADKKGDTESNLRNYAEKLKQHVNLLIETGQYGDIAAIVTALKNMVDEKDEKLQSTIKSLLEYFYSDDFIDSLIISIRLIGRLFRNQVFKLVDCYGKHFIPYLLNALIEEESPSTRSFLIALILYFGRDAIEEVVHFLGDNRWFVKRNMIYILSESGYEDVITYVKPYCRHENIKVRIEAIKCLLKYNDPYGKEALKELLYHEDQDIVYQAIILAGAYRVKEVVPDLLRFLKRKGLSGHDLESKIPIVKSLGQIGAPEALKIFKEILLSKSVLFKSSLERLKEEVVRALKNFRYDQVEELVEISLNSKNERISTLAKQLKKRVRRD